MGSDRIGEINSILRRIQAADSHDESGAKKPVRQADLTALECSVYADGFRSPTELALIESLGLKEVHASSFENPEDYKRYTALTGHGGETWERYQRQLLNFRVSAESIQKSNSCAPQQSRGPDSLPKIQNIVRADGSFFVTGAPDGEFPLGLALPDGQSVSHRELEAIIKPYSAEEIYLGVNEFIRSSATDSRQVEDARALLYAIGRIMRQQAMENETHFAQYASDPDTSLLDFDLNALSVDPSLFNESDPLAKLFRGRDGILPEEAEGIRVTMGLLPKTLLDDLAQRGVTIHLENFNQRAREAYNNDLSLSASNDEINGLTYFGQPHTFIVLDRSADSLRFAYTLSHEIGHDTFMHLDTLKGGEWNKADNEVPGAFAQIARYHYDRLQMEKKNKPQNLSYPTLYGASNYQEWFPEIFAIYQTAKSGETLTPGLGSLDSGIALPPKELLEAFKAMDPIGYLLIAKLDQAFTDGSMEPEDAFSWTVYSEAEKRVSQNGGKITPELEGSWKNFIPDMRLERSHQDGSFYYNQLANDLEQDKQKSPEAQFDLLVAATKKYKGFYPLYKDLLLLTLQQALDPDFQTKDPQKISAIATEFFDLVSTRPWDSELKAVLGTLTTYDMKAIENADLGLYLDALANEHPEDSDFALFHARWLTRHGHAGQAAEKIDRLLLKTDAASPRPTFKNELNYEAFRCYLETKQLQKAEAILTQSEESGWKEIEFFKLYQEMGKTEKIFDRLHGSAEDNFAYFHAYSKLLTPQMTASLKANAEKWQTLQEAAKRVLALLAPAIASNKDLALAKSELTGIYSLK